MRTNRTRQILRMAMLVIAAAALFTVGCASGGKGRDCGCEEGPAVENAKTPVRYGMVIRLKPGMYEEYKRLHANVWPEILEKITECNIRNYSIYHKDGYLFSYFEYVGDDFEADIQKMVDDPKTQEWWKVTDPCQEPLETREEGEWWANMEELFHHD